MKKYIPLRVRLRSSQPLASNSLLQMPRKFSSGASSPLKLLLELPLPPAAPRFFSTGITAAIFQTSFRALAFNVAAPRKAAIQFHATQKTHATSKISKHKIFHHQNSKPFKKRMFIEKFIIKHLTITHIPVAAAAVKVMISPADLTFTAEPTTEARCSRSAPMASAASTHWAATNVAADATAVSVFAICSSLSDPDEAAVAAAIAATAAATAATETAAWSWALWALVSSFFFSFLSLSHLPTVLPPTAPALKWPFMPAPAFMVRPYCRDREERIGTIFRLKWNTR